MGMNVCVRAGVCLVDLFFYKNTSGCEYPLYSLYMFMCVRCVCLSVYACVCARVRVECECVSLKAGCNLWVYTCVSFLCRKSAFLHVGVCTQMYCLLAGGNVFVPVCVCGCVCACSLHVCPKETTKQGDVFPPPSLQLRAVVSFPQPFLSGRHFCFHSAGKIQRMVFKGHAVAPLLSSHI